MSAVAGSTDWTGLTDQDLTDEAVLDGVVDVHEPGEYAVAEHFTNLPAPEHLTPSEDGLRSAMGRGGHVEAYPVPEAAIAFEKKVQRAATRAFPGVDAYLLGDRDIPEPPRLVPVDLARALKEDPPPTEFLGDNPYLPAATKILAVGPAEAAKSIAAMHWACQLSRAGITVVFVSQENPLVEDLRRLRLLRPDPEHFVFLSGAELDLAVPRDVDALEALAHERVAGLIVLDTLTAVWASKGEPNDAFTELDRAVLTRLRDRLECIVLVVDHTGYPQAFVNRSGVNAPRGASAKGQKVDVLLEFRAKGERTFILSVAKYRVGGRRPAETTFEVVDTEDGINIMPVGGDGVTLEVREVADAMVEMIQKAGALNSSQLQASIRARKETKLAAMRLLREEAQPRVEVLERATIEAARGTVRGTVWAALGTGSRVVPEPLVPDSPEDDEWFPKSPPFRGVGTTVGAGADSPPSEPSLEAVVPGTTTGRTCVDCGADVAKVGAGPGGRCFPCS